MTASLGGLGYLLTPGLVMMAGGVLLFFLRGAVRDVAVLLVPLGVLALVWLLPDGPSEPLRWLGYELVPFRSDALGRLFGTVFCVAAFAGGLYALRQERRSEIPVAFLYAGTALGVVFAADLITVFVFWELMAVFSTLIVWLGGHARRAAGQRYAVIHLFGGVLLMAGIAGHVAETGSIAFEAMRANSPANWLILIGFMLNAGSWPLSAWLPDAYPEASWSGTVFLSAFTTKTAVLVLLRGFPGEEILIVFGLIMIFYGIVYAILENDMRRILAYSIVNQVGFMVTGIGIGSEMALNGAAAHAFVHIIYKALLLMSAGSVLLMTGRAEMQRAGRPVPHHAVDDDLRHHRRHVDLGVPAHLRIRRKINDFRQRRRRGADDRLVSSGDRVCRRVPPCRHQVPMVRLLPEGLGIAAARPTLEHAGGDASDVADLHRHRGLPRVALSTSSLSR